MNIFQKIGGLLSQVFVYWKKPMNGKYMSFREIVAYSGGGIGAYMIITIGTACLLSTSNTLISSTLAVEPTDMYILYVIAVLANIPLTGIRANIIDNTRNKAGKYRPYIVSMGIPTAIICVLMVCFPYDKLEYIVGTGSVEYMSGGVMVEKTYAYIAKCALILVFNLLLHFFYYFFYDGYENLIHVLSPDTQERANVASVKSVVYSFAPTVVNLITPIIAEKVFDTNATDLRVYKLLYPILGILGILLCIIVYAYTEEKIVQARTHVVQIRFRDALREVAKNKYFWIISLAGWIGFLENSYTNILYWLYNYGGTVTGTTYGIIWTIYGNASLWGMLLAPICIKKWGKKAVLLVTNFFNIIFILLMLPVTQQIEGMTIWLVLGCLYMNGFMGSFAHILNPAIQADIRDYQQYKTGERIDGMFSAVATIGTLIALATSSVLPAIYERNGITSASAKLVTSNPEILSRRLAEGKTVGELLAEQLANGQDNFSNAYSALYDLDILSSLLHVVIIVSAVGALMNVIPYFWYDFNERKQKAVIRVLKVRAMFEDFGNGISNDEQLVEGVDIVRNARMMSVAAPRELDKKAYKSYSDKLQRKMAKKQYREDFEYNEEIEISKFVCEELDKYSRPEYAALLEMSRKVYAKGLDGLNELDINEINHEIGEARAMVHKTASEKEARSKAIELAKNKKLAIKEIRRHFKDGNIEKPDYADIEKCFNNEDECDALLKDLYKQKSEARKLKDNIRLSQLKNAIDEANKNRKALSKATKAETDRHAIFNRAAKPYLDAEKMVKQAENYANFSMIDAEYDEAKVRLAVGTTV